jgi:hypothetical protein
VHVCALCPPCLCVCVCVHVQGAADCCSNCRMDRRVSGLCACSRVALDTPRLAASPNPVAAGWRRSWRRARPVHVSLCRNLHGGCDDAAGAELVLCMCLSVLEVRSSVQPDWLPTCAVESVQQLHPFFVAGDVYGWQCASTAHAASHIARRLF